MADLAGANGQRTEFKVVGKPNLPGKLSYNLATGKAKFGSDAIAPNMLHAKFLRSPYANAVVKSVDISKAKALPGRRRHRHVGGSGPESFAIGGPGWRRASCPLLDNIADQEDAEVGGHRGRRN